MPLSEVIAILAAHRGTFSSLYLGMACLTFAGYANSMWVIKLFAVKHAWSATQAGVIVGIIIAFCGALGAVGGGNLADVLRSRGRTDANLRVALLGAAVMAVASVCYPLANSGAWAAAWLAPLVVGFSAPFGVVVAAIQQLVPGPMRAQATALFLFVINLLGMALGPLVVGWLTDRFSPDGQSLHLSLMVALVGGSLGAVLAFTLGLKCYRRTDAILAAVNPARGVTRQP